MRFLIKFSYDGTNYSGFQTQKKLETIQEKMEDALNRIFKECENKIDAGASIIILSDRKSKGIKIPSLVVSSGLL